MCGESDKSCYKGLGTQRQGRFYLWARGAGAQGPAPKWGPAVCEVRIKNEQRTSIRQNRLNDLSISSIEHALLRKISTADIIS